MNETLSLSWGTQPSELVRMAFLVIVSIFRVYLRSLAGQLLSPGPYMSEPNQPHGHPVSRALLTPALLHSRGQQSTRGVSDALRVTPCASGENALCK